MARLQRHHHITACGEQRGISLTQQDHALTAGDHSSQSIGSGVPGLTTGLRRLHHREHQWQRFLIGPDPVLRDPSRHADRADTGRRGSDHIGLFDRSHGRQCEQIRIAGADSHNRDTGTG